MGQAIVHGLNVPEDFSKNLELLRAETVSCVFPSGHSEVVVSKYWLLGMIETSSGLEIRQNVFKSEGLYLMF